MHLDTKQVSGAAKQAWTLLKVLIMTRLAARATR